MSTEHVKNELITDFNKYISILNQLPLHPKNKLQVISKFIYSKIRWQFSIYRLSETWVIQNLDSIIKEYVKRWLQLPQSANFRHLCLPTKQLGMKFSLPSDVYLASQLITRKILKASDSKEIQEFYNISRTKYINEDVILQIETPKNAKNNLTMATIKTILKDLSSLKEQNAIMNAVAEHCSSNFITLWQKVCDHLPKNLYVFTRKAIVFSLANSTNLARWKKVASNQCGLCKSNKQTQIHHMLNNCPTTVQSGR